MWSMRGIPGLMGGGQMSVTSIHCEILEESCNPYLPNNSPVVATSQKMLLFHMHLNSMIGPQGDAKVERQRHLAIQHTEGVVAQHVLHGCQQLHLSKPYAHTHTRAIPKHVVGGGGFRAKPSCCFRSF